MDLQPASPPRRRRFQLAGVVQGVRFRPFVFRLATELGLAGWVLNDESGVTIDVEGFAPDLEGFAPDLEGFGERLRVESPPLSSIDSCRVADLPARGETAFKISGSTAGARATALVTPDTATCDSGFLYPFLGEQETDLDAVLEDVRASVRMKADEVSDLRRQTLQEGAGARAAAAAGMRRRFDGGGTLMVLGNGGSATDAMDVVADFRLIQEAQASAYHVLRELVEAVGVGTPDDVMKTTDAAAAPEATPRGTEV